MYTSLDMKRLAALLAIVAFSSAETPQPATVKPGSELMAVIMQKVKEAPQNEAGALAMSGDGYTVALVHREATGLAASHGEGPSKGTEVHYIVEGAATVVTGGTIVRSGSGSTRTATVEGGVVHNLKKGDVLFVPAGTPHWYKEIVSPVTYFEVRFNLERK